MGNITCLFITVGFGHRPDTAASVDLHLMVNFWRKCFHPALSPIIKKMPVNAHQQTYLLVLHLHFLPCPPRLPLPQCHRLPPHFRYHLLNHSYFHHCFLKKKRGNTYSMQTGRTVKDTPELLLRMLYMK